MNTCPKCGNPVEEEKAFCPTCGEAMTPERERSADSEEEEMGETIVSFSEQDSPPPQPAPPNRSSPPTPPATAAPPPVTKAQPVATPPPVSRPTPVAATPPPVKAPPPRTEPPPPLQKKPSAASPASGSSSRQPPAVQKSAPAVSNRLLYLIFGASAILFALSILILVYLYVKGRI